MSDHLAGVRPIATPFAAAIDAASGGEDIIPLAEGIVRLMSDHELLWMLDGDLPLGAGFVSMASQYNKMPYRAGQIDRLGIPGIRFADGPRGVVPGASTGFPVALARAATWDIALEKRIGDAIGAEASAQGANLFGGICVNLAYIPGWGRSQESYGDDPVLLGAMGAALTRGVAPWVMSCVKHFALNSMEEGRFTVDVQVADDVLHEVYLPHFKEVVEAGADSVMSAYNAVNGSWAGDSRQLLTTILRDDWKFAGFVMTDFIWGLRDPIGSVAAGQDLEMPFRQQRAAALPAALADGRLARSDAERAAVRLVAAQLRLALRVRPTPPLSVVASAGHRQLAREAATRGMVLLRNATVDAAPALPLNGQAIGKIVLLGPLADQENQGDVGSSKVRPPYGTTVLQGLREHLGERLVQVAGNAVAPAVAAAREADAAVIVVGLSSVDEGESMIGADVEALRLVGGIFRQRFFAACLKGVLSIVGKVMKLGGDRRDLRLHADDVALIRAVAAVNRRTIVVVVGGGTVVVEPWDTEVAAVLCAWYPGMEGGRAVADVLLGYAEPAGRLPMAIPHRQEDLPQLDWRARRVTYGRWWGQRALDRSGVPAAYPLGFGLGWTTFSLAGLELGAVVDDAFAVQVLVTNIGARTGHHVVQVYALPATDLGTRAHVLVGFQSVLIEPGATQSVRVSCSVRPLQKWDGTRLVLQAGSTPLEVGAFAGDTEALTAVIDHPAP